MPKSSNASGLRRSVLIVLLTFAAMPAVTFQPAQAETALIPEKNPPGDIPDTQVFVDYPSSLGFTLRVPEGWARSETPDGVRFVDKLDGVAVTVSSLDAAPTLDWVKSTYLPKLESAVRAPKITSVKAVTVTAGKVIRIAYRSNSEPNAVTSKQVRLENERYLFWKAGKLVALDLYAPLGADNLDHWTLMSNAFGWR